MSAPFVKICGLSTPETLEAAVQGGADAVGFLFAPSVRQVTPELVRELVAQVPDHVETVGVFRKQPIDEVIATAQRAGVDTIQFHGYEPHRDLVQAQAAGFRTLRAFGVDEYAALSDSEREQWAGERLLVDAAVPGAGVPFRPEQFSQAPTGWWLLAGGLTPENVGELIAQFRPSGVDVSSGVESRRGTKSPELIRQFLQAAKSLT